MKLIYNAIQTPDGTILESVHRHDFKTHLDKNGYEYIIDGGLDYVRYGSNCPKKENMDNLEAIFLTEYDNGLHEKRRKYLKWGKNYDKDMNLLPKTEWVVIKDLEDSHLEAILRNVKSISPLYKQVLEDEIIFREQQILKSYE